MAATIANRIIHRTAPIDRRKRAADPARRTATTMPFWRLYYHIVWATYQRAPLLSEPVERQVYGAILGKAEEMGIAVHAIGGVQDHLHVVVSIPPKIAVADSIKHFKGASSYYVNRQPDAPSGFSWQDGYGALTVGQRGLSDVVAYVLNQKEHHRQNTTRPPFERITIENDGVRVEAHDPGAPSRV